MRYPSSRSYVLIIAILGVILTFEQAYASPDHETRTIEGWTIKVDNALLTNQREATEKALTMMQKQLAQIILVVPAPAVEKLRKVTLWLSPEYPGVRPSAEYHPGAGWLKDHGRNPSMVKGVEFTNISNFEAETKRMPNFVLHELAHSYHDQVLQGGFANREVKAAYEHAKASKCYDSVERSHGDGRPNTHERAYAMNNPQEYFAESSEAFFGRNDFFPFTRTELRNHDAAMFELLGRLWEVKEVGEVTTPPASMKLPVFYTKYINANGYPVIASSKVNDFALKETAYLVNLMLAKRPDVKDAMVKSGSRMVVMAWNEFTTDIPEYADFKPKDYWDARARGLGGSQTDPVCSCAEENVLAYPGDPYSKECIVIHEFAHNIHLRGMVNVDPSFDRRVKETYDRAMAAGLWKTKYASTNHHEYFAEGVQSWFDNNRVNDHDHNHVHLRSQLKEYDPGLAKLCEEVFGETKLAYSYPTTRLRDHLFGYDPTTAPRFIWPERLEKARADIRKEAENRGKKPLEGKQ